MATILFLSCSPRGADAISSRFGREVVDRLQQRERDAAVIHRDLSATPPSPASRAFVAAVVDRVDEEAAFAESEQLIKELEQADIVVLATPMHNFSVPALLKAWVDQIVRIRRTFASTPSGKEGLLRDRPVYVVISSGGWFTGPSPSGALPQPDFLRPYLRTIFKTIGILQVHFLASEGTTRGDDVLALALAQARRALDALMP
jgi:FMN-dependent NADH-azoreductase